jgi:carboxylesterase type B
VFLGIIRQEDVLAKMNHQKYFKDIASITFYYDGIVPYDEFMDVSEAIKDFYFGEQEIGFFTIDNLTNAYSDRLFNQGVRNAAMYHAQHAPVYPYVFAYNPDIIPFDYSESPFHFDVGKRR